MGKWLMLAGLILVVLGGGLWILGLRTGTGTGWLPGDIVLRRGSMTFSFPIVTCVVVSVILSLLMRFFSK